MNLNENFDTAQPFRIMKHQFKHEMFPIKYVVNPVEVKGYPAWLSQHLFQPSDSTAENLRLPERLLLILRRP